MRAQLLAGALAFALWGGVAAADDCPKSHADSAQPVGQEGTGGSGASSLSQDDVSRHDASHAQDSLSVEEDFDKDHAGTGGSGRSGAYVVDDDKDSNALRREARDEGGPDMRGLTVTLGGGVEGYTGQLAPVLDPGLAWGVNASLRPTRQLGLELGYSGAANTLDTGSNARGIANELERGGAALVRNGGYAAVSLGLTPTAVQPYLMGGVGVSRYNVRGAGSAAGLRDDTVGSIPLGGGIRAHIGDFTADARVTASPLFSNQFAPDVDTTHILGLKSSAAAAYSGTLQLGATF